jgi:starch-binding outer membrane protein, SusD/RagB family
MPRTLTPYIALAAAVTLAACDARQPLLVSNPSVASPSAANDSSSLPFLESAALADFAVAYVGGGDQSNGGHEGIANMGAIFTDEYNDYDTFQTRAVLNLRDALANNTSVAGVFQDLGQAHNDALRAQGAFAKFGPADYRYAEMEAIDGYNYILVAEHWCSGEPFSTVDLGTGQITYSPFLTTAQMLDTALARFQQAKAVVVTDHNADDAEGAANVLTLAQVGAARALLDLGQISAAADSAAAVKPGSAYSMYGSTNSLRQNSGLWYYTIAFPAFSVADSKNGTGLNFQSDSDPRVLWIAPKGAVGSSGVGPFIVQQKYPGPSATTVVGDYTEGQLIVAEGDIFAGNYAGALAVMNALRTGSGLTFPAKDALVDLSASTPKAQMLQLLSERAFWMYVTGHRLGDWRRMLRAPYNGAPFNFVTSDVYPVGTNISSTLEFPTPTFTSPNPNYKACDPTQP